MSEQNDAITFDIIIEDGFVLTEYAAIVDVLRVCNRTLGVKKFSWEVFSKNGGEIQSPAGASVQTTAIPKRPNAAHVVFVGNVDPFYPAFDPAAIVPRYVHSKAQIILLAEAASRYIATHPEVAHEHTTHWENRALIEEAKGIFGVQTALAQTKGQIVTAAGMSSTSDLILATISPYISAARLAVLSKIFLVETIRPFATAQSGGSSKFNSRSTLINSAVELMQANVEEPLKIREMVKQLGTNSRRLEREFQREMNCTPNQLYRELRLEHAHNLLLNTDMSIAEVSIAAGFWSGFAKQYQSLYGQTPTQMRKNSKTHSKAQKIKNDDNRRF